MSSASDLADLVYREFYILPLLGGSYGFFHTKLWSIISYTYYSIAYTTICLGMLFLTYTTYLLKDNLSLVSQSCQFLIVGATAITASGVLTVNRNKCNKLIEFSLHPNICEYAKGDYMNSLTRKTYRRKIILILVWVSIYGLCGIIGMCQPLIDGVFGTSIGVSSVNGAWVNLPIVFWSPYDLENSFSAWFLVYLFQVLFMGFCALMFVSPVVLWFNMSDRLLDQLKLLNHAIENVDALAKGAFYIKYPKGDMKEMPSELDECYYECIRENIKHHHKIKVLIANFIELTSISLAVPFFGGAALLAMAAITLISVLMTVIYGTKNRWIRLKYGEKRGMDRILLN